jgi:hypothetical protein
MQIVSDENKFYSSHIRIKCNQISEGLLCSEMYISVHATTFNLVRGLACRSLSTSPCDGMSVQSEFCSDL